MAAALTVVRTLYLLIISIVDQKGGTDLRTLITNVSNVLVNSTETEILNKFKVVGEGQIVAVVNATNTELDRIVDDMYAVASIRIQSQPVIPYESFAESLGVPNYLTRPVRGSLRRESIYWFNIKVDYFGFTTDQLLSVWRSSAVTTLTQRYNGTLHVELYKRLAENEEDLFINVPDLERADFESFRSPLVEVLGSNIRQSTKALLPLDDYVKYKTDGNDYY